MTDNDESLREFESTANKAAIERQHEMEKAREELLEVTRERNVLQKRIELFEQGVTECINYWNGAPPWVVNRPAHLQTLKEAMKK